MFAAWPGPAGAPHLTLAGAVQRPNTTCFVARTLSSVRREAKPTGVLRLVLFSMLVSCSF